MARYIDAEKIDFSPLKNEFDKARAKVVIMGQPTADVVPVVRCKDCVAKGEAEFEPFVCSRIKTLVYNNCFCSFGIRKGGVRDEQTTRNQS